MPKFIVICGPDLKAHDSQVLNLIDKAISELRTVTYMHYVLPEADYGADQVRDLTWDCINSGHLGGLFVTRYSQVLETFGEAISLNKLARTDVLIRLVEYEDGDMHKFGYRNFYMTDEGVLSDGWPFGVLS
jgi:hypothetical protein